ncbi:MAG: TraR/DksA C4-type zinc finger protein [Nitrospinota bacterium]
MEVPAEELFTVRHLTLELPPSAEMHEGVVCEMCQEPVMDTRALKKEGRILCIPCSKEES